MQKQEQYNVIISKLLEEENKGEVSKQLDKTGFGANKEKVDERQEFEKVGILGENIREERKPPDETVFKTVFKGSKEEEIRKGNDT